jgi:hypothetical protein
MQLKMREAPIVQAQMEVKNLYLKYLETQWNASS